MRRDRLERLADLLESDPSTWPPAPAGGRPPVFHLGVWYAGGDLDTFAEADLRDSGLDPAAYPDDAAFCCAVGLAAITPACRAEGFCLGGFDGDLPCYRGPDGRMVTGWRAVDRYFEFSSAVISDGPPETWRADPPPIARLFFDETYPPAERSDPKAVARRIRRLLAGDPIEDWDAWKRPAAAGVPA